MCCPYKDRWRNTQAVQGNGLENRQGEQSPLEFESLFLRHQFTIRTLYAYQTGFEVIAQMKVTPPPSAKSPS